MDSRLAALGASIAKRAVGLSEDQPQDPASIPALTLVFLLVVTLLFVPAFLLTSYSLQYVYTTLAVVENPHPAAYEAVASDDHDATPAAAPGAGGDGAGDAGADAEAAAAAGDLSGPPQPVTASLRRTYRLLKAAGGWRGNFRGLGLALVLGAASAVVGGLVGAVPVVPSFVGRLLVQLALVQLSTAWVHAVLRAGGPNGAAGPFWRNLPPFRRTFEATGVPVVLSWLAHSVVGGATLLLAGLVHLDPPAGAGAVGGLPHGVPTSYSHGLLWKTPLVVAVGGLLTFALVVPTTIVLVRVQASLLPPEDDAVVPFDRSFNGTVEPAVVGGKGYATMEDAFRSFSRASWKRLLLLYVKVYAATLAVNTLYAAIVLPVVVLTSQPGQPGQ